MQPGEGPVIDLSFGRLATGVSLSEADAELAGRRLQTCRRPPADACGDSSRIGTYARSFLDADEPGLAQMMGAARVLIGIVVLVVAVNVGALVYARNAARVGEVALRMALGASRRRIAVQMFLEALVLASVAGAVGIALMAWPLHLLSETFAISVARGGDVPYWFAMGIGPATALVVVGLVILCAVLTGILPALSSPIATCAHASSRCRQACRAPLWHRDDSRGRLPGRDLRGALDRGRRPAADAGRRLDVPRRWG